MTPAPVVAPVSRWRDTPRRYGGVSRGLHWGMALLFLWQFAGMVIKELVGRGPLAALFVGSHRDLGTLLLLLLLLRAVWALWQWPQRPPHEPGWLGRLALLGHLALYGLMGLVPALALLRQYGSGRAYAPFGLPLMETSAPVPWMVAWGNALHGWLAWLLLALIAGHVAMALLHRWLWRDALVQRMLGTLRD